jgi:hypothetical protein
MMASVVAVGTAQVQFAGLLQAESITPVQRLMVVVSIVTVLETLLHPLMDETIRLNQMGVETPAG